MKYLVISLVIVVVAWLGTHAANAFGIDDCKCSPCACSPCECN